MAKEIYSLVLIDEKNEQQQEMLANDLINLDLWTMQFDGIEQLCVDPSIKKNLSFVPTKGYISLSSYNQNSNKKVMNKGNEEKLRIHIRYAPGTIISQPFNQEYSESQEEKIPVCYKGDKVIKELIEKNNIYRSVSSIKIIESNYIFMILQKYLKMWQEDQQFQQAITPFITYDMYQYTFLQFEYMENEKKPFDRANSKYIMIMDELLHNYINFRNLAIGMRLYLGSDFLPPIYDEVPTKTENSRIQELIERSSRLIADSYDQQVMEKNERSSGLIEDSYDQQVMEKYESIKSLIRFSLDPEFIKLVTAAVYGDEKDLDNLYEYFGWNNKHISGLPELLDSIEKRNNHQKESGPQR